MTNEEDDKWVKHRTISFLRDVAELFLQYVNDLEKISKMELKGVKMQLTDYCPICMTPEGEFIFADNNMIAHYKCKNCGCKYFINYQNNEGGSIEYSSY